MCGRAFAAVCVLVVIAGCLGGQSLGGATTQPTTDATTHAVTTDSTVTDTGTTSDRGTWVEVEVLDGNGSTLGEVDVMVADTPDERYTGLSDTESLGPNEGMLFVYADEGEHTFVMRSMSFPIDIVYVDRDGRITSIHHATVEDDNEDLTPYEGRGKWVLEVPYNWTVEHGVEEGDVMRVHD